MVATIQSIKGRRTRNRNRPGTAGVGREEKGEGKSRPEMTGEVA